MFVIFTFLLYILIIYIRIFTLHTRICNYILKMLNFLQYI